MDLAIQLFLAGLAVGTLISLTGMGGGAFMTPFLILVMKVDPALAVGTDLVFAAITKWVGGLQHRQQNNVGMRMVAWMALGSLPASFLTSDFVLAHINQDTTGRLLIARILGAVLILVSIYTLARVLNWVQGSQDVRWPPAWALVLIGAIGGGLVGLTSVGGGTIIMAALLIFFAIPAVELVGLNVMHGALLASVPAIVYASGGLVNWQIVAWLLLGSIPGTFVGTRLVSIVPQRLVRGALSLLLIVAGVRLFF